MTRPPLYLIALASALSATANAGELQEAIQPVALVQLWGTLYDGDLDPQADPAGYGDPEDDPGVKVRRVRIGLQGHYGVVEYAVTVGAGSAPDVTFQEAPLFGIVDAWAGVRTKAGPGELLIQAGSVKVPVSRELLMSSTDLLWQERTVMANHLSPFREAGLLVDYRLDFGARVRAGVFNGNNNLLGDDNFGLLYAARLEFGKGLQYITFDPNRGKNGGIAVSAMYNDDLASSELKLAADGILTIGPINVTGEFSYNTIKPTDTTVAPPPVSAQTNQWGAYVQVSGLVKTGELGHLEIGARGELFDDNSKLQDNGDLAILYAGATWRDPLPGVDIGAGYIHREELNGTTVPNDTVRVWTQVRFPRRWKKTVGVDIPILDGQAPEASEPAAQEPVPAEPAPAEPAPADPAPADPAPAEPAPAEPQ